MRNMIRSTAIVAATAIALPASALNILLTNDDGYGTYGITQLELALSAAGHNVYVSAPAGEQSGKSGSVTTDTGTIISFEVRVDGKEWSIGTDENPATPADSVDAGLYGLTPDVLPAGETIDLVISGVNDGENISRFSNASGTVGAAMWARGSFDCCQCRAGHWYFAGNQRLPGSSGGLRLHTAPAGNRKGQR